MQYNSAQDIKNRLSADDVDAFMCKALNAGPSKEDGQGNRIFLTVDRHPEHPEEGSYKLYYYPETHSFYSFTGSEAYDIFSLVQAVKGFDFKQAFIYVCGFFNISTREEGIIPPTPELTEDWDVLNKVSAYEKALVELDTFTSGLGFKVIAGATFVGEHSYSSDAYPVAVGRPDADDLALAEQFGGKVSAKITAAADLKHLYGVDVARIQRPRQPFWPLFRFLRKVLKLRKSGVPLPRTPQVQADLCTHCGYCVSHCPTGAIVKGDECSTIAEKCIRCCACVKGCPQKARSYDTPFAALLSDCFVRPKENRIII